MGQPFVIANTISRVLYSTSGASIIYLRLWSPTASSNLPPDIGRATLNCRYTWSCNPRGAQPSVLLPSRWALTPPSHPYPCGRLFSSTLLYPHGYQAVNLRGALRCSDFPPPPCGGSDRARMRGKGTKKVETTNTRNKKTTPEGVVFRIESFSYY